MRHPCRLLAAALCSAGAFHASAVRTDLGANPAGFSGFRPLLMVAGSKVDHPALREWARQCQDQGQGMQTTWLEGAGGTLLTVLPARPEATGSGTEAPAPEADANGPEVLAHAEAMVTEDLWTLLVGTEGHSLTNLPATTGPADGNDRQLRVRIAVDATKDLVLEYRCLSVPGTGLAAPASTDIPVFGTVREKEALPAALTPQAADTATPAPDNTKTFYRLSATLLRVRQVPEALAVPDVVVVADRVPTPRVDSPAASDVIPQAALEQRGVRTLPEALNETTGVAVQKTSYGQGSPYIRGFTGFRTLLLVDGIRLNHPAFREGANQYWNTVDSGSLERLEILRGASSVLYGSDAVGGTVQAFTRSPAFAAEGESLATGRLFTRLASAERSATGRFEGTLAEGRWAMLAGVGAKTFGDLEGGHNTGRQRKAGYDETDLDFKLRVALDADRELVFAYQNVAQDDIWRTHRTPYGVSWHGTTVGTEKRHVFDQDRQLAYARYLDAAPTLAYDELTATLYLQRQAEDKDVVKKDGAHTTDGFDVDTLGLNLELRKETSQGLLVYGGDWVHDRVDSYRVSYRGTDGLERRYAIQGPVGDDATVDTLSAFAEHRTDIGPRWTATPGLRATRVETDVGRYEDFTQDPHAPASLSRDWTDLTGSFKLARRMTEAGNWTLYGSVAQSFRAPNLSDLTRFDDARSGDIEIPSPDVDPEHFVTAEVGSHLGAGPVQWHSALFRTWIDGLIVRTLTGSTNEFTKTNAGDGYVHGVENTLSCALGGGWSVHGGFAWMEGYSEVDDRTEYVRTMPMTVLAALRRASADGRAWVEVGVKGVDKEDRLTVSDKADTQRIPPGGTPGYGVCHARAGWRATDALSLGLAVENLFDQDYRVHGSGSNEAGRNVILTASCTF